MFQWLNQKRIESTTLDSIQLPRFVSLWNLFCYYINAERSSRIVKLSFRVCDTHSFYIRFKMALFHVHTSPELSTHCLSMCVCVYINCEREKSMCHIMHKRLTTMFPIQMQMHHPIIKLMDTLFPPFSLCVQKRFLQKQTNDVRRWSQRISFVYFSYLVNGWLNRATEATL